MSKSINNSIWVITILTIKKIIANCDSVKNFNNKSCVRTRIPYTLHSIHNAKASGPQRKPDRNQTKHNLISTFTASRHSCGPTACILLKGHEFVRVKYNRAIVAPLPWSPPPPPYRPPPAPSAQERSSLGWLVSYARMTSACDTLPPSSCEKANPSTHINRVTNTFRTTNPNETKKHDQSNLKLIVCQHKCNVM